MSTMTKEYATMTIGQLKQLIEECDDNSQIRIWVEMYKSDAMILEGRRLIGVVDDPNDNFVCLVAGYYTEDEE